MWKWWCRVEGDESGLIPVTPWGPSPLLALFMLGRQPFVRPQSGFGSVLPSRRGPVETELSRAARALPSSIQVKGK